MRERQNESTSLLPKGYMVDASEAGLWILKRVDGSMVAVFLLEKAGSEALQRAADADVWG